MEQRAERQCLVCRARGDDGACGLPRQLCRERSRGGGEFGVVRHLPDKAPAFGLFSAELVAGHGEAERARDAHTFWQKPRAARVGHQADLHERLNEARGARSQYEVAGEREIRACASGCAVDRGDHRHRQRL